MSWHVWDVGSGRLLPPRKRFICSFGSNGEEGRAGFLFPVSVGEACRPPLREGRVMKVEL